MEVLKDAASAAIYGAQAGNGVVLITTKSGSKGTSSISYDFQYSISSLAQRPKLINSQEALLQRRSKTLLLQMIISRSLLPAAHGTVYRLPIGMMWLLMLRHPPIIRSTFRERMTRALSSCH